MPLAVSSARTGWLVASIGLVVGVPLFARMPPWTDLTLYQTAAAAWLDGDVPYRCVFDTNLPGFPALLVILQSVTGPSNLAARLADLAVVAAACGALGLWAKRCGATPGSLAWLAAGCVWFYLFTTEFNHCQRDAWALLPAAVAALMRTRRLAAVGGAAKWALLEGVIWGAAVWIKPHVVIPALAVWLAALPFALKSWGRAGVIRDTLALVAGGLAVGGLGLGLIAASGAWADFWEVMTVWNPAYGRETFGEFPYRVRFIFAYFPVWSYLLVPAGAFALVQLIGESRIPLAGCCPRVPEPDQRPARATLAAFFLGWFLQALVLQKWHDYIHVPELFLALALLAGRGWSPARWVILWIALAGAAFALADRSPTVRNAIDDLPEHRNLPSGRPAAFDPDALRHWPECFGPDTPELRDALARLPRICCTASWVELEAVAQYLERVEPPLGDKQLLTFHDSPHPLYLRLGVEPETRFMHVGTACLIPGMAGRVGDEIRAGHPRYVVSDFGRETMSARRAIELGPGGDPLKLPAWLPEERRGQFPFDRPIVFRSGRYAVHEVGDAPIGIVTVPGWWELKQ